MGRQKHLPAMQAPCSGPLQVLGQAIAYKEKRSGERAGGGATAACMRGRSKEHTNHTTNTKEAEEH